MEQCVEHGAQSDRLGADRDRTQHDDPQRTIVLVLHDLNQAARYSHHLIAMSAGRIVACGSPCEVITEALVHEVFGLRCRVLTDPVSRTPMVLPIGRHNSIAEAV